MYYYIGWPFKTDNQLVTSAGSTNPQYLTDWFTSRKIVTASSTGLAVHVQLSETSRVDYVFFYDVIVPPEATSYRIRVYDDLTGAGTVLLDSQSINLPVNFASSPGLGLSSAPVQLGYVWTSKATKRLEPSGTGIAKSVRINLNASPAASWSLGYVAAGEAMALSVSCKVGAGFGNSTRAPGNYAQTFNGGVTDSRASAVTKYPFQIRSMSESDAETLRELFSQVRDTRPFFLYPSEAPSSRAAELGIVRFAEPTLPIVQLGGRLGSKARYSLSTYVTPWR